MKSNLIFLILILVIHAGCRNQKTTDNPLSGFWNLKFIENIENQNFVIWFYRGLNKTECQFHSYSSGMKYGSMEGSDLKIKGEKISFIANQEAAIRFKGILDTTGNRISGNLIYRDGSKRQVQLNKIPKDQLLEEYPGLAELEKKNTFSAPVFGNDGWPIGTLKESGIDSVSLRKMVNLINENHYGKINSVLIAKNGKLIFEKYFDGFWTDDLHSLQSCTKSIGSLLIGIAIDKNYINSVDQKVMEFFPEYASGCDPGWNKIKLEHLLTMSMGLKWDRNYHDAIYDISDDVIKSTFGQEVLYSPGEKFEYRNPQTDLISGIIINTTKNSVQDFAKINLFDPLGIKKFYWPNFKNNDYCLMSGSLALQSRDMLKIGQLIINEGKWGNSQIISKNYINESVTFKIKTDQGFDYGYLWWLGESEFQKELKAIFAMGISGQLIVIIPETEMVIVTTSDNTGNTPELLLKMIDEYIIKNTVFL